MVRGGASNKHARTDGGVHVQDALGVHIRAGEHEHLAQVGVPVSGRLVQRRVIADKIE